MQSTFPKGIEIAPVGGTGEVGRNMTAVRVDEDVFIFDMGLHLPNYIKFTEEDVNDLHKASAEALRKAGAIPDDTTIKAWRKNVKAIILGHAHLDHIGAVPFLANHYDCPIIGTPYTLAVLRQVLRDEKIALRNKLVELLPNSSMKLVSNVTLEFVHVTHSIPQSVLAALHTTYGTVLYATDFKFDNHPVLGKPPSYERLEKLGRQGVLVAMVDALYAGKPGKMPSESVAREMLRDILLGADHRGKALVITTFSSHIARLKSIVEFGKQTKRKLVFLGRSLAKYAQAAEEIDLVQFSKEVDVVKYAKKARRKLNEICSKGRDKFLLVVTGHQGEPQSILAKMVECKFDFRFEAGDHVIFSSNVIPVEPNISYRKGLEFQLQSLGVRFYTEVHASGHAAREDIREFLQLTKPVHAIPTHAEPEKIDAFAQLWNEMNLSAKNLHLLKPGQRFSVPAKESS